MIEIKSYKEPDFNKKELLRYALCKEETSEISALLTECIDEARTVLSYRVCYERFAINVKNDAVVFPFMAAESKGLSKNLKGCRSAVVFAATVGIGLDRLIAKYARLAPAKALLLDAIGAERIESLCNVFNEEIQKKAEMERLFTKPRFSPGYGDFSLDAQQDIFRVLDCPRQIGLTLNESLLMSPSKSVTAIIGISNVPAECSSGCGVCKKTDCEYRRKSK